MTFSQFPSVTYSIICLISLAVRNVFFCSNLNPKMPIFLRLVPSREGEQLATSKCSLSIPWIMYHLLRVSKSFSLYLWVKIKLWTFNSWVYHQSIQLPLSPSALLWVFSHAVFYVLLWPSWETKLCTLFYLWYSSAVVSYLKAKIAWLFFALSAMPRT